MVAAFVALFTTISLAFQVLPVITVPLTGNLALSRYNNYLYGVFGWCHLASNGTAICTAPSVGYTDLQVDMSRQRVDLPSKLKYSFTKLLIVHPLSLIMTFMLWIMVILILLPRLRSSPGYLLVVALYSAPVFLCCLLAFLIDILLFISHLAWTGWLLLASTVVLAICCSLLWTLRRAASVKKYEALYSDDRVFSIDTYSMGDFKTNSNNLRTESSANTGSGSLAEPGLTYSGSID